ncbi:amino acid ABC transporter substrate-binding protein [Cryobacterium algoricola]|uniref:ABC transporter substrate-binding protein n=2 Tax=Cryobacterium TaxID=69578 RepID=A0AA41QZY1_9MICO|nr:MULTISPECIES: ABC transporter substrate-binding protein [Cryobacterium]MCI4659958.1 ABC transporter substrate-binding protein [Cryobacterium zhongshanensis]TFB85885.1 amino acid ABC transporter substrate-binding protein [Cryobacterium algoricola]
MLNRRRSRHVLVLALSLAGALLLSACSAGSPAPSTGSDSTAGQSLSSPDPSMYLTPGKLTIGTGEPAYFPWVIDDSPASGKGFEAAVAYAVAGKLGFAKENVTWVRSTFDEAIAPGPKGFDFNLQQFSITAERAQQVDFSSPYYETTQAVITVGTSPAAGVTSLAGLKGLLVGAATGTTSFIEAEKLIAPTQGVQAFNTNDDAKLALQNGTVDAIVVDLPTAFYLTGVELDGGTIIGQLPDSAAGSSSPTPTPGATPGTQAGTDAFGLVLAKDSPLTAAVSAAVDALRADGTLANLADTWLAGNADAPVLK